MIEIIISLIKLFGGSALFLYGMNVLGSALEKVSGGPMERVLQKLTSNPIKGVVLGAAITACIQSSAATTVVVVGLVNAGVLQLSSAVGVIMGANIGTTVTAQILRLGDLENSAASSVLQLLKPATLAPIAVIIGLLLYMLAKRSKYKDIAQILIGFGVLFTGMLNMEQAIQGSPTIMSYAETLFSVLTNPFLGVLVGAVVTALVQSSSATVGILQALSTTGKLKFGAAFPIILGQNIGTCITSLISSVGAGKNAKRAAMVHLYFNVIGTVIFLIAGYAIQYTIGFPFWDDVLNRGSIANFHTIFNVVTTCALLPFNKLLIKLAELTIRNKVLDEDDEDDTVAKELDDRLLLSSAVALVQVRETVAKMGALACKNCRDALLLFDNYSAKLMERIQSRENTIDRMEDTVSAYLVKLADLDLTESESREVSQYLHVLSEFERVGDYAINLSEQAAYLYDKEQSFSEKAKNELKVLNEAILEVINTSVEAFANGDGEKAAEVEPLEETIDILVEKLKRKHIRRLKEGKCTVDLGIGFLETLTNIERMSDHCSNVAVYVLSYTTGMDDLNRHEYISALHKGEGPAYAKMMEAYNDKYLVRIE